MLSMRSLVRSAPRCTRSYSCQLARQNLRGFLHHPTTNPSWRQALAPRSVACFTTSIRRFEAESPGTEELVEKLASELAMEKEMRDQSEVQQSIREYIDNCGFKLHDVPGKEEVVLTRKYFDEDIRVSFSIDDINHTEEDPDQLEESSLMDELDDPSDMPTDMQSGGANTKGSVNKGRISGGNFKMAPEDSIAPADRPELADEESEEQEAETSFPAHVHVTIKRPKRGALQVEAIAQDGVMVIENIYYYKDAKLADAEDVQTDWAKRDLYTGPSFGNLDEDLQVMFEKYLEDRGINTAMALFVPDYIDHKEQKEYLTWLEGVKGFLE